MKLCPKGTRDPDEIIHYNKEVSSAALLLLSLRVKVEWAFGLFKVISQYRIAHPYCV